VELGEHVKRARRTRLAGGVGKSRTARARLVAGFDGAVGDRFISSSVIYNIYIIFYEYI
jgi:hypothetical protein